MDKANVIKLAIDAINGKIEGNFTDSQTSATLRKAFIDANGGDTKMNMKKFYRGNELFDIIEEILPYLAKEGLDGNEFFNQLVEYRNLALGDINEFVTEDRSTFVVADLAAGTMGIRRQRLNAGEKTLIKTQIKAVKVYEHLDRLMSGRVDFNVFVDRVSKSFSNKILEDIYKVFDGITSTTRGLSDDYVLSGTPTEDQIIELIDHVEASTGMTAKIIGTKAALKKMPNAIAATADQGKTDMYNLGYYGKFNGTDMVFVPQKHKAGTDEFIFSGKKIWIIASDDKPIKVVDEGEGLLKETDAINNQDLTQEYAYLQKYGVGVICSEKLGIVNFA